MKRFQNTNEVFWGKEPEAKDYLSPLDPNFPKFMSDALAWYNYSVTSDKKKSWFIDWVKNNRPKVNILAIEQITDGAFTTAGAIARMVSRGLDSAHMIQKIDRWISEFTIEGTSILKSKAETKAKKAAVIDARLAAMFESLDSVIDSFIEDGYKTQFSMNEWMRVNTPSPVQHSAIKTKYAKLVEELMSDDNQIAEGYSFMTNKQYERFSDLMLDIVTTKKVRKPRVVTKKRATSPEKATKRVKFAQEDTENGIKSIEPKAIPGSKGVVVWNKKYRVLGVYTAIEGKDLEVKGSTIQNFDEDTSIGKKIRKPNDILPKMKTATKVGAKKIIDSVKTKPVILTGRINSETIILKVF